MRSLASILHLVVLFTIFVVSSGSLDNMVKIALLKKALYHSAVKTCDWVNPRQLKSELLNGVDHILKQANKESIVRDAPQPDFLRAVTEAFCSTRNFHSAVELAKVRFMSEGYGDIHASITPVNDAVSFDSNDNETLNMDTESMAESKTFPTVPVLSFVVGAVVGSFLAHYYFLLGKSAPAPKALRRPEL